MKGRKVSKPRGKTCNWTQELDEILKAAWARGGLRAARRAYPAGAAYCGPAAIRLKRRAATLALCLPKEALRWTDADENHLLWSIDSNASLALIAERLGRSLAAVRKRLRSLDYTAESLGGYKVGDVADVWCVPPARVQYCRLPKSCCLQRVVAASPIAPCRSFWLAIQRKSRSRA